MFKHYLRFSFSTLNQTSHTFACSFLLINEPDGIINKPVGLLLATFNTGIHRILTLINNVHNLPTCIKHSSQTVLRKRKASLYVLVNSYSDIHLKCAFVYMRTISSQFIPIRSPSY